MGRLDGSISERAERFAHRVLDVTDVLMRDRRPRRTIDQITGSGTSVGANIYEADEAMSRPDFCKSLGIVIKELNETRFWLRLIVARKWIGNTRLAPLQEEAAELKRIFGSMLARTRKKDLGRD